jgi:hypothetical protein
MGKRYEFTQSVKNAALERSKGRCEAVGKRYGLPPGERCQRLIGPGQVHYDHYPLPAHDPNPATRTLENCVATCPQCNMHAAYTEDIQREWKIKRIRRKHGLDPDTRKPRKALKSQGFAKPKEKHKWPKRKLPSRPKPAPTGSRR